MYKDHLHSFVIGILKMRSFLIIDYIQVKRPCKQTSASVDFGSLSLELTEVRKQAHFRLS